MPAGALSITVVAGRDLKNTQWVGRQDPYVVVEAGSSRFTTKTHTDGGKNPKFNQKFELSIGADAQEVKFTCWNANMVHTDDYIGSGRVLLSQVFAQGYLDTRVPLSSKSGKSAGELVVIFSFAPTGGAHSHMQQQQMPMHSPMPGSGGELVVQVLRGSGLKDVEVIGHRQDPYCVVQVGSTRFRTKKATDGGKNPKFDDRFVFSVGPQDTELKLECWDANVMQTDKIIGSGRLSLSAVMQSRSAESRVMLSSPSARAAGEVVLFLTYSAHGASSAHMPYGQPQAHPVPYAAQVSAQHAPSANPLPGYGAPQAAYPAGMPQPQHPSSYPQAAPVSQAGPYPPAASPYPPATAYATQPQIHNPVAGPGTQTYAAAPSLPHFQHQSSLAGPHSYPPPAASHAPVTHQGSFTAYPPPAAVQHQGSFTAYPPPAAVQHQGSFTSPPYPGVGAPGYPDSNQGYPNQSTHAAYPPVGTQPPNQWPPGGSAAF